MIQEQSKQLCVPVGSLDAYIHAVNQVPLLSLEEETALAWRFREAGDLEAARKLVMSHLRFVVRVARGYSGYGLALADLIQEGNIGLMKAVKRFDPERGVRLVSVAIHWIRAEIHEFVLRNWRVVRVATTKAQRKLFFNLRSSKKRLGWMNPDEVDAMAQELKVKPEDVLEMEQRLSAHDTAFENPVNRDEQQDHAPATYLADQRPNPEQALEMAQTREQESHGLAQAMTLLDQRSRDIIQQRWLSEQKTTLQELATKYRVSAERIRQIEGGAMKTLREHIAGGDSSRA